MADQLTTKDIQSAIETPEVRSLVREYLALRTKAEIMRKKINKVQHQVLTDMPVYATDSGERIMDGGNLYLSEDDELCAAIFAEFDRRERKAGIKPADMHPDYCPALIAEHAVVDAERAILQATCPPLGIDPDEIYRIEDRDAWIGAVVGATTTK